MVNGKGAQAQIATRFGDEAAKAYRRDHGDDHLYCIGPFGWLEAPTTTLALNRPCWFWVGGQWCRLEGQAAFEQALAGALPDLTAWQPITQAWCRLVGGELLPTRADVDDYGDPRWHVLPWSAETRAAWQPPHVDGGVLRFCVEDHRSLVCVSVWQETYAVSVQRF